MEKLRQRVTGPLAPPLDSTLASLGQLITHPPSYEAYREFLRGEALFYTDQAASATALARAAALDSTFLYPLLREISLLNKAGRLVKEDSLVRVVERRRAMLLSGELQEVGAELTASSGERPADEHFVSGPFPFTSFV